MPLLTAAQIDELRQIIQDGATALSVSTLGDEVTGEELQRLVDEGYVDPAVLDDLVLNAFTYGQLSSRLEGARQMSFPQFAAYLRQNPVALSGAEREAYQVAAQRAGTFCRGLGNRYSEELGRVVVNADSELAQTLREGIAGEVAESITLREGKHTLVRRLRQMSGQMTRDWTRIAVTESHLAHQEGFFEDTVKQHGMGELMAKVPERDACFIAGTKVITRRGEVPIEQVQIGDTVLTHRLRWRAVVQKFERAYAGRLIGVNGPACATVNHPYLRGSGWQRADALKLGEEILCVSWRDANDQPAPFAEEGFLAGISGSDLSAVMPFPPVDLDSNAHARQPDVQVVGADGVLDDCFRVDRLNQLRYPQMFFAESVWMLLACAGVLGASRRASRKRNHAAGLFRLFCAILWSHLRKAQAHLFAVSIAQPAKRLAQFAEAVADGSRRNTIGGGQRNSRLSVAIGGDDRIHVQVRSGHDHDLILCAGVQTVNGIESGTFVGLVYNLEVEDDHSYFANGIAVHNCDDCLRLYLGPDGKPAVHPASWWAANGSNNVGRKKAEWRAVLGAVHPWCRCQLATIPAGWEFDDDWSLVPVAAEETEIAVGAISEETEKSLAAGTIHTWADGRKYQKRVDGSWQPVSEPQEASTRTGVIRVDPGTVRAAVDKLLGDQAWNRHGILAADLEMREHWVEATTARGDKIQVRVIMRQMPVTDPRGVKGAHQLMTAEDDRDYHQHLVWLDVRRGVGMAGGWDRSDLAEKLRSVLSHELAHAGDPSIVERNRAGRPTSTKQIRDTQGVAAYYNNPAEITARMHQIWREITDRRVVGAIEQIRKQAKEDGAGFEPDAYSHLHNSETWDRIKDHLTPDNKRRILRMAARAWEAIQAGRVDPTFEKAQGGPFIGPRGGKWADPQHTIPWHERIGELVAAHSLVDKAKALREIARDHDLYTQISNIGGGRGRPRQLPDAVWEDNVAIAGNPAHPEHAEVASWIEQMHDKLRSRVAPTAEDRKAEAKRRKAAEQQQQREKAEHAYERQGSEVEEGTPPSKLRGKMVWLYHGTSDKHLPFIRAEGLRTAAEHGRKRSNVGSSGLVQANPNYVYLSARATGAASAEGYARAAAYKTGGDPVILRVLVSGDDLARDPDDKDIAPGRYQYVTDRVTVGQIKEIDGERLEKSDFDHPLAFQTHYGDLAVSVENRAGSYRRWYDKAAGREGKTLMTWHYGRIPRTRGVDGDAVDVFLKPGAEPGPNVYVITAMKPPEFKKVDEQKVMLGARSRKEAKAAYLAHYNDPRFYGHMTSMPLARFCREIKGTLKQPKLIKHRGQLSLWEKGDREFSGYAGSAGAYWPRVTGTVVGMGRHSDPARTPGENVLDTDPVTEWPPFLDRPVRKRRKLQRAAERLDIQGLKQSSGGFANPPNNEQVQAERGEVEKDIGRAAVSGHRYREELDERQRRRVIDRGGRMDGNLQAYHRGVKPREDDDER